MIFITELRVHDCVEYCVVVSWPVTVPEGIRTPTVSVINDTTVRVLWRMPIKPNGPISAYLLLLDNVTVDPRTTWPTYYDVGGLRPYTIYSVQVSLLRTALARPID